MPVKAQPVSRKQDNKTWCRPNKRYNIDEPIEIELDQYVEVDTVQGELPESDEKWPKGASDFVKVGDKILKKRDP